MRWIITDIEFKYYKVPKLLSRTNTLDTGKGETFTIFVNVYTECNKRNATV